MNFYTVREYHLICVDFHHHLQVNLKMKKRIKLIPLARMATIKEVVKYIYFLSSNENTLITNEVINISGGE